ncbi:MAG: heme ABC exporter ATP-binding protein CcmA [Gemmatimonadetes bacterium]|nr:heme ABC exporter ATP-binding protein CcmA [Gemmatimonadota bacterium]
MARAYASPDRLLAGVAERQAPSGVTRPTVPLALELAGIARRFGQRWVLRGASLQVPPGEALALVGRNGTGKTTLLRIAATLLRPTRGTGRVYGLDVVREAPSVREIIGLLGHAPALYEDLTAGENLRFACRMRGRVPDAPEIARLLDMVGLLHDADRRVRAFSAGMRRRLALARLLLEPPRLLLMDEPYASLDVDGVECVNALVRHTKARGGAVVMATHDLRGVAGVVDRVALLETGVLRETELDAVAVSNGPASPVAVSGREEGTVAL